ncbi:MAG: universal stress protein [Calditrichaeota bacterium]|nr:universal stress protein [Calditrichota bacterium]
MLEVNRILFPTDFSSCADAAFNEAIRFARIFDAEIIIFHSCILPRTDQLNIGYYLKDIEKEKKLLSDHVNEQLLKCVDQAKTEHIKISHHQENAVDAAESIVNYAKEVSADLIVMGTHGRHGFSRAFMGSVAEKVVRLSDCPVCTIKHKKQKTAIGRIVVPIDFSPSSRHALLVSKYLAELLDEKLILLNIISYSSETTLQQDVLVQSANRIPEIIDKRNVELKAMFMNCSGPNVEFECNTKVGAAYEITKFAKKANAHLVIISSHGNHEEKDILIGSTSEKVIRNSDCPVLTLKTFGKQLTSKRK